MVVRTNPCLEQMHCAANALPRIPRVTIATTVSFHLIDTVYEVPVAFIPLWILKRDNVIRKQEAIRANGMPNMIR